MHRSACSSIGTVSGQVLTVDLALVSVPEARCAQCEKRIDLQAVVMDVIFNAVTGSLSFPARGQFPVVLNRGDDGRPLSIQIMLRG